jgi:hypothetical protein
MTEIEVRAEFLLIDFVIVHHLEEFFKLFDEAIVLGQSIKGSTRASAQELVEFESLKRTQKLPCSRFLVSYTEIF